ncbi:MAG: MerR family transcriptional regulator [Flavobacteriales bacterium]|nr:MerR family transcriptional regulator [Flavobacteriales bacterium]
MPYKEKSETDIKLYYTIGEVADKFGVNASLIRFWEKEFEALRPKKNATGKRLYTKTDLENLQLVYNLVKIEGYTLEGAKKVIDGKLFDNRKDKKIIRSLQEIRMFLHGLRNAIENESPVQTPKDTFDKYDNIE